MRRLPTACFSIVFLLYSACGDSPTPCEIPDAGPCPSADACVFPDAASDAQTRECESNPDCVAPTSVCDAYSGRCVECLVLSDCAHRPGTVCSAGACTCPEPGESWCDQAGCVDLDSSSEHCGSCGRGCFGACSQGACVDPWERVSDDGAPEARARHLAVWTGSEMIVWGGEYAPCDACTLRSGGLYDPDSRLWRDTSEVNAPSPRRAATAVWTGAEMLVWGGQDSGEALGSGGRFDPATNTWSAITTIGAPSPRYGHSAVWSGTELIVWGGTDGSSRLSDGARYSPQNDSWAPMTPLSPAREGHQSVWLGGAMLIYGGQGNDGVDPNAFLPTASAVGGWSYNPGSNQWNVLTTVNQPQSRALHTATVLGDELLIWGGFNGTSMLGTGAVYGAGAWVSPVAPEPAPRRYHTAVTLVTPALVALVWGGEGESGDLDSGGIFDAATRTWAPLLTAPSARRQHTAVSTGDAMILWGGISGPTYLSDGGIYRPL